MTRSGRGRAALSSERSRSPGARALGSSITQRPRRGQVTGYVDLGELGVADRWWDLAAATWSLNWNLGPGFEDVFLAEYGAELDAERTAFYRLLYDLAC